MGFGGEVVWLTFLFALIAAVSELINTMLFTYYFAAIFVAFSFTLVSVLIMRGGKNGC